MHTTEPGPDAAFHIVLNAGSGAAETELRCTTIREVLAGAGRTCELAIVEDAGQLKGIARRMAEEARSRGGILVAAGGDGTINAVAYEAVLCGCAFGVLPQGTFNYFGRTHGIPEDLGDAVRSLLASRVTPVQIGMVNDRIFLVNASVGLYPRLLEEREQDKRHYGRSRFVAFLSAIKLALRPHRHMRMTLEFDGQPPRMLRTSTIFIGNNALQLEQVGLKPLGAAIEEGRLAAIAPRPTGKLGMLGLLLRGALGRLGETEDIVAFPFRRLTVHKHRLYGRRRMKVGTDGEVTEMALPLEFRVLDGRLALLTPVHARAVEEPAAA